MSSFGQAVETATWLYGSAETGSTACKLELLSPDQFSCELSRESERFVETQRTSHPFQLPSWSAEANSLYAVVRINGELRLLARCGLLWPLGRRFDNLQALTITRGPVCDDADLLRVSLLELVEKCRSRNFLYLDVNPEVLERDLDKQEAWLSENGWFPVGPQRASLRVDLCRDLEGIRNTFRKSTRYEIRRAEAVGVELSEASSSHSCEKFLSLYRAMARHKEFAADPESDMRRVVVSLFENPARGVLLVASYEGEALGGVVVVRVGTRCWYVWGASRAKGAVNVGHVLQWHAIRWAKRQGCTEYDLGGYCQGATDGPGFFKRGFSQTVVQFMPPYRYVTNPAAYNAFKVVHGGCMAVRAILPFRLRFWQWRETQ